MKILNNLFKDGHLCCLSFASMPNILASVGFVKPFHFSLLPHWFSIVLNWRHFPYIGMQMEDFRSLNSTSDLLTELRQTLKAYPQQQATGAAQARRYMGITDSTDSDKIWLNGSWISAKLRSGLCLFTWISSLPVWSQSSRLQQDEHRLAKWTPGRDATSSVKACSPHWDCLHCRVAKC